MLGLPVPVSQESSVSTLIPRRLAAASTVMFAVIRAQSAIAGLMWANWRRERGARFGVAGTVGVASGSGPQTESWPASFLPRRRDGLSVTVPSLPTRTCAALILPATPSAKPARCASNVAAIDADFLTVASNVDGPARRPRVTRPRARSIRPPHDPGIVLLAGATRCRSPRGQPGRNQSAPAATGADSRVATGADTRI